MSDVVASAQLAVGIVGCCGVVNALVPIRRTPLLLLSWISAWVVTELIGHVLVVLIGVSAVLVGLGALGTIAGWIGLGLSVVAVVGGVILVERSRTTVVSTDPDLVPGEAPARYPRSHIALPLLAWVRRDISVDRGIRYGPSGWQKLDVYRPKASTTQLLPAIINIHGGGWVVGSRREQGVPLLGHLAASGWVGFNVDYRLAPKYVWPAQIVDVKSAIMWVRTHAADYGVDPNFIAVTGGSAGGHLSALAALTPNAPEFQPGFENADTSVAACVPFYGVYDMVDESHRHSPLLHAVLDRVVFRRTRAKNLPALKQASPMYRIGADAPPFFVVHGSADSLIPVEESREFFRRLGETSSSAVHYAEIKGGQHAFDVIPSWRTIPVIDVVRTFLNQAYLATRESAT